MKFNLKKPCAHCPFRSDIRAYLTGSRAQEIADSLELSTFACHETTEFRDDGSDEDGEVIPSENEQHCAGAIIFVEKTDIPSQMLKIAERLGLFDPTIIDKSSVVYDSVYNTVEQFVDAQPDR